MSAWQTHLKKFREEHPDMSFKECMQNAKHTYKKDQQGAGVMQTIQTVKTLISGQTQFKPEVRKLLEQVGNIPIKSITIYREPIKQVPINTIMNVLSAGGFNVFMQKYGYDQLFHLYMIVGLSNGQNVQVEKNERIDMKLSNKTSPMKMQAPIKQGLTLNSILDKTQKSMGSNFFPYNPFTNNCQHFVTAILRSNGLLTSTLNSFINQNVSQLFNELEPSGKLQKLASSLTKLGTIKDIVVKGGNRTTEQYYRDSIREYIQQSSNSQSPEMIKMTLQRLASPRHRQTMFKLIFPNNDERLEDVNMIARLVLEEASRL